MHIGDLGFRGLWFGGLGVLGVGLQDREPSGPRAGTILQLLKGHVSAVRALFTGIKTGHMYCRTSRTKVLVELQRGLLKALGMEVERFEIGVWGLALKV